ncbi:MAG: magnesium/cobalt transporter CorA [Pseudomonadota bacterium]|nr:magnesium/cobalt transporter CorA [Pseudomonadota bacterium]
MDQPASKKPPPKHRRKRLSGIERSTAPGAIPGTLEPLAGAHAPVVTIVSYGPGGSTEHKFTTVEALGKLRGLKPVLWIDVSGLADATLIAELGKLFGLHALALEDVINVHQRPKVEEYKGHMFIVARMVHSEERTETEQFSCFLGRNFLLTFQERHGDCFGPVRERIRSARGRVCKLGPDYLCYALIDAMIDGYFPVLERYGEVLERLEDQVVESPRSSNVRDLHELKRELLLLRRAVWPHREMVNALIREENPVIEAQTRVYLRDCYDHTIQLMDIVETYREIASGLVDVHISSVSARLNEIMKVLTIIATIFIPLGFIASLYGMNFDTAASPWNMPELKWYLGYPFVLAVMGVIAGGLLWYFWRKGWLGGDRLGPR